MSRPLECEVSIRKWHDRLVQLARFTDLALRALMLLAVTDAAGAPLTAARIASEVDASAGHVAKAVSRLVALGLVEARRGQGGGVRITEAGRTASVGRVVRDLEGPGEVVDCAGDAAPPCPLAAGCRLRRALAEAREAFFATLDPLTVADLTTPPTRRLLLELTPAAGS